MLIFFCHFRYEGTVAHLVEHWRSMPGVVGSPLSPKRALQLPAGNCSSKGLRMCCYELRHQPFFKTGLQIRIDCFSNNSGCYHLTGVYRLNLNDLMSKLFILSGHTSYQFLPRTVVGSRLSNQLDTACV